MNPDIPFGPTADQTIALVDAMQRACAKEYMVFNAENLPATLDRLLQRHYTLGDDAGRQSASRRVAAYHETLRRVGEVACANGHLGPMQHIGRIIHETSPDTIHTVTQEIALGYNTA